MDNKHIWVFMAGVVVLMIGVAGIAHALMEANSNITSLEDIISTMQTEVDELRPQISALQSELDTTKSRLILPMKRLQTLKLPYPIRRSS